MMPKVKTITNITIFGLTFYYDEQTKEVGFPTYYDHASNTLDYRVGHQYWIEVKQAQAIIQRVYELQERLHQKEDLRNNEKK